MQLRTKAVAKIFSSLYRMMDTVPKTSPSLAPAAPGKVHISNSNLPRLPGIMDVADTNWTTEVAVSVSFVPLVMSIDVTTIDSIKLTPGMSISCATKLFKNGAALATGPRRVMTWSTFPMYDLRKSVIPRCDALSCGG